MDEYTQLRLRRVTRDRLNAIKAQIEVRDGERITTDDLLSRWVDNELAANPGMAERVRMTVQLVRPQEAGR